MKRSTFLLVTAGAVVVATGAFLLLKSPASPATATAATPLVTTYPSGAVPPPASSVSADQLFASQFVAVPIGLRPGVNWNQ